MLALALLMLPLEVRAQAQDDRPHPPSDQPAPNKASHEDVPTEPAGNEPTPAPDNDAPSTPDERPANAPPSAPRDQPALDIADATATRAIDYRDANPPHRATPADEPNEPPPAIIDIDAGSEPAPDAPIDVLVSGEKSGTPVISPPVREKLSRRDVSRMPGAFGDAFRAIEVLPGVAPLASGVPHMLIRGATPAGSGYFVDDIRVPFLFHLAIGPSVMNPALMDDVSFYPGAYPTRYGRHVGGIVAATTREPTGRWRAEGTLRTFDAGGFIEAPLVDGDLTVFGGGRYSFVGPILKLFSPGTSLNYWDYQAGAAYRFGPRDSIRLLSFGSRDDLANEDADGESTPLFGAEFHRINLRYRHTADPDKPPGLDNLSGMLTATIGLDSSIAAAEATLEGRNIAARGELVLPFGTGFSLLAGFDVEGDDIRFDSNNPSSEEEEEEQDDDDFSFDIGKAFGSRGSWRAGGYLHSQIKPWPAVTGTLGLRFEGYGESDQSRFAFEPRATLRLSPLKWLTTITAAGLMHQQPNLLINIPAFEPVGLNRGLQQATQISQGVSLRLPEEIKVKITGFYNDYRNLTDLTATCDASIQSCSASDRADGRSYGMELMVQRPLSTRVGGLLSYTLSRTERTFDDRTFYADFDRRHVLNAAIGVDLGRLWHAGGRLSAYSGRPHSLLAFDDPEQPNRPTLIGKRNALRRGGFYRVDLRLEKRWVIAEQGFVSLVIELFNVTFQKETVDFDCRVSEVVGSQTGLDCGGQAVGPISVPSIGVSGGI